MSASEEPDEEPSKNIVLLSDGTGNAGAKAQGTNVWALYEHLDRTATAPRQIAFYDDGVGTQKFLPLKIVGGAFGYGLFRNVKQLYLSLVGVYRPGDSIYLLGFSRGAHTVRTVCGLIARYGILRTVDDQGDPLATTELRRRVDILCRAQRLDFDRARRAKSTASVLPDGLEESHFHAWGGSPVRFLGVWDTVDAVGLPFNAQAWLLNHFFHWRLPNRALNDHVECARHALSLDDRRKTFWPTLLQRTVLPQQPEFPCLEHPDRRDIEQVWFAGVHTNVGGGYDKDQLAYEALHWMLVEATEKGLRVDGAWLDSVPRMADPLGLKYESRGGAWAFYRFAPRPVARLCTRRRELVKVHASVVDRLRLDRYGYSPHNLPDRFLEVPRRDVGDARRQAIPHDWLPPPAGEKEHESRRSAMAAVVTARTRLYWGFIAWLLAPAMVATALAVNARWEGFGSDLWKWCLVAGGVFSLALSTARIQGARGPRSAEVLLAGAATGSLLLAALALFCWLAGHGAHAFQALSEQGPVLLGSVFLGGCLAFVGVTRFLDGRVPSLSIATFLVGATAAAAAAVAALPGLVTRLLGCCPERPAESLRGLGPSIWTESSLRSIALLTAVLGVGCILPSFLQRAVPRLFQGSGWTGVVRRMLAWTPGLLLAGFAGLRLVGHALPEGPLRVELPPTCAAWTVFAASALLLLFAKKVVQDRYDANARALLAPLRENLGPF